VTGRNRDLRARFQAVAAPPRHRVHVLGFTNAMDELLAAADLVLTKPGGLTISEALARGAGLVLLNPIPGQEERNRDYLLAHDAAIQAHDAHTLPHQVEDVLRNPNRLARLRQSARRLGRPRAAFEVAEQALGLLDVRSVRRSRPTPTAAG
jgi:processive 1,2-diacylglycerol beta-glucosyltransferase